MGAVRVPAHRLWGAQTQRSLEHFHFPGETMPLAVICAQVLVKKAAAIVNVRLGELEARKGRAIVAASTTTTFRWWSGRRAPARRPT